MSDDAKPYKAFLIEYPFDNARWVVTIYAQSWEEAEARMRWIGTYGRVQGSDAFQVHEAYGPLVRLCVWLRNAWSRRSA